MKQIHVSGIEVTQCAFEELPEEIPKDGLSDNGSGMEYANYIVVYHNGKISNVFSDAMEPEDARFYRDLDWVTGAIKDAYDWGRSDGITVGRRWAE